MHFAFALPVWLSLVVAAGILGVAYWSYRRPFVSLSPAQRVLLAGLRALALAAIVILFCRPVFVLPPRARDAVVPVLIDVSRSMSIADVNGESRIAAAAKLLKDDVLPALSQQFTPELYAFGDEVAHTTIDGLRADAPRTSLDAALTSIRERYRGRRISGVLLLSDGGDTDQRPIESTDLPVFIVGVGNVNGFKDREIVAMSAGDPQLGESSVDVRVAAVAHGYGRASFDVRVKANGQLVETRRLQPAGDGSPIDATFTVTPDPDTPTLYTAEIDAAPDELVADNNSRAVLVSPAGRKRRVLTVEGSPGYEHSFLNRAIGEDPSLDLDAVVRKGKNDNGQETFFVQAAGGRAAALAQGLPSAREALFGYDAVIVANVEGEFFSRAQLDSLAAFVGERGGGLLVMGARAFAQRGYLNTPLEEVLPVDLSDRRAGAARAPATAAGEDAPTAQYALALTRDGETHPVLRMGQTVEETRKRWAALPPLVGASVLGSPRPGATVLAVTNAPGGIVPLVAVQRYGRGRSMAFAGEASWRWRMMMPSTDHTYERFWRQAVRWLAVSAPDPLSIMLPDEAEPGDSMTIEIEARDAAFVPAANANVTASVMSSDESSSTLALRRVPNATGRFSAMFTPQSRGLVRIHADATNGQTADRWIYVGGAQRELTDPRLNEGVLRRLAQASHGQYVTMADASRIVSALATAVPPDQDPETRDAWHTPWVLALVIGLLSAEWILRRRWGLR